MTDRDQRSSPLLARYAQGHPAEFALAVAGADGSALNALLASLPESVLPAVVVHLPKDMADELLDRLSDSELVRWLSEADLESAVPLARRLDQSRRASLADRLPARRRKALDRYCSFPDSSVGAWVDPGFASVGDAQSIGDAMQALGSVGTADRTPWLVVDGQGRLVGGLDARLAMVRGPSALVRECLAPLRSLKASAHLRTAAVEFAVRDEPCLPVVDGQSRPIGLLHRTRLPDSAAAPDAAAPPVLATLAGTMFDLLAEVPALAAGEGRAP